MAQNLRTFIVHHDKHISRMMELITARRAVAMSTPLLLGVTNGLLLVLTITWLGIEPITPTLEVGIVPMYSRAPMLLKNKAYNELREQKQIQTHILNKDDTVI